MNQTQKSGNHAFQIDMIKQSVMSPGRITYFKEKLQHKKQ